MKKIVILICFLLFVQLTFANQEKSWQEFYNQSFGYFYNFEYEKSIEVLERALELDPSQSAIYWRLSFVLWFKAQRDYHYGRDIEDLKIRFDEITDKGMEICRKPLKSDPNNPEIRFYLGALYSQRGEFIATTRSQFQATLKVSEIKGNIEKSNKELALIVVPKIIFNLFFRSHQWTPPFYYESLGYLGLHSYGTVVIPKSARKFINKREELGLEQIKNAMKYSKYSDDVKETYRGILQIKIGDNKFRDRISEAIELTEDLLKKYPGNLNLKIDLVALYWKKGELVKAEKMGRELHQEISKHPDYDKFDYLRDLYRKLAGIRSGIQRDTKNKGSS